MGKIFGISDLPVSTIMTPFENIYSVPKPIVRKAIKQHHSSVTSMNSMLENQNIPKRKSIISMRNGIGKLMKHFSKSKNNAQNVIA